jgi:inorganic pyrophosphatase
MSSKSLSELPVFDPASKSLNIVIEVTKGARTKLKYDEKIQAFRTEKVLPLGLAFPFDFGFIPSTLAQDGDPLDVIVLSEPGIPSGTVVFGEPLGILECEQTEKGRKERNDRVIARPLDAKSLEPMQPMVAYDENLKAAISGFFTKYNELQNKEFRVLGLRGHDLALAAVRDAAEAARRKRAA